MLYGNYRTISVKLSWKVITRIFIIVNLTITSCSNITLMSISLLNIYYTIKRNTSCRLQNVISFMPWFVDHMIQQGVWPMRFSYPDPLATQTHWQNPDTLAKSRPTGKIQTHWLGHKVVHIVTSNIQKLKSCFHQYFNYIHKFYKTMA